MPDYIGSIHVELTAGLPMSFAETRAFSAHAKGILPEEEVAAIKVHLGVRPLAGDVIEGSGGVRKLRWRLGNAGKRAGVRVIYYYHDRDMPIYLLAVYAKSEKLTVNDVEKATMRRFVKELVREYSMRSTPKMIS
jgi:hypothetical protein